MQGVWRGLTVTVLLGVKLEKMFNSISFNSATFIWGQTTSSKVLRQGNISILFLIDEMSERSTRADFVLSQSASLFTSGRLTNHTT